MLKAVIGLLLLAGCALETVPTKDLSGDVPSKAVLVYAGNAGRCSAVAIEPQLLVTARHCVLGIGLGWIKAQDRWIRVDGDWASPADDIGLLHVSEQLKELARIGDRLPQEWEPMLVTGFGCDSTQAFFRQATRRAWLIGRDVDGALVLSGLACHGDSGGGVFDNDGQLLAITVTSNGKLIGAEPVAGILDGLISPDGWIGTPPPF